MQDVNQKFYTAGPGISTTMPGNVQNSRSDDASIT